MAAHTLALLQITTCFTCWQESSWSTWHTCKIYIVVCIQLRNLTSGWNRDHTQHFIRGDIQSVELIHVMQHVHVTFLKLPHPLESLWCCLSILITTCSHSPVTPPTLIALLFPCYQQGPWCSASKSAKKQDQAWEWNITQLSAAALMSPAKTDEPPPCHRQSQIFNGGLDLNSGRGGLWK